MHHNVSTPVCQWIHNFLSNRKLFVKVSAHISEPLYLSVGTLTGLYSLSVVLTLHQWLYI